MQTVIRHYTNVKNAVPLVARGINAQIGLLNPVLQMNAGDVILTILNQRKLNPSIE